MGRAKRRKDEWNAVPAGPPRSWAEMAHGHGDWPGGQVGQMQADLFRRLAQDAAVAVVAVPPHERVIHFLSISGGYLALLAAYGGAAFLVLH